MSIELLLDVSRPIARRWSGRSPTGIDRASDAYCEHFAGMARAVIQLRGRPLILDWPTSQSLFAKLDLKREAFRQQFTPLLARALTSRANRDFAGSIYLNPGHSDYDLPAHARWTARRGYKPVYLLHDLIPVTHPHFTLPHKLRRHRGRVMQALQAGAGIIVNSEATKDELLQFAQLQGVAVPPVHVGHLGTRHPVAVSCKPDAPAYFLALGTIEARKNHALLLRVWAQLAERMGPNTPRLICAGNWGIKSDEVRRLLSTTPALAPFIEIRSGLRDEEIASLLAGARALLMPSLAEGFGLPMVEALEAGVPVIANDLPVFREIGQGIPLLVPAENEELWVDHVAAFAVDCLARRRQVARMGEFRPPRWDAHFAALDQWLTELAHAPIGCQQAGRDSATAAQSGSAVAAGVQHIREVKC